MPLKKHAAQASAQNIQAHFANQKCIKRTQNDNHSEFHPMPPKRDLMVTAQTVPTEIVLDPELTDFCSHHDITPAVGEIYDNQDDSDLDLCVSDQSSDIEEESELKRFSKALQDAQVIALKQGNKNKRGWYSKRSKKTLKRHQQFRTHLASQGFFPLYDFLTLTGCPTKDNKKKPESDEIVLLEGSEGSDEANGQDRDTCMHSRVSNASEMDSKGDLPGASHNTQLRLAHRMQMESEESSGNEHSDEANGQDRDTCMHSRVSNAFEMESEGDLPGASHNTQLHLARRMRMESEESSGDEHPDKANGQDQDTCMHSRVSNAFKMESEGNLPRASHTARLHLVRRMRMESEESSGDDQSKDEGHGRQPMRTDETEDEDLHTTRKLLGNLRREAVLTHQDSQRILDPTAQLLSDRSKLQEARTQLMKEEKRGDLDVIVRARIAAMISLLSIYTQSNMGYSWRKASEIVATTQGRGKHRARRICKWVMDFLKWRDLPIHEMNRKRGTIIDDEDIAEEIQSRLMAKGSSLKAEDVVDIVASPEMQAIFTRKGITKASICVRTAHRWLEKLGWTHGKTKNGMYLDGHERLDVVEYRKSFVERWMGYERRFHRWDHDGTELPRPDGFLVSGAIGRFRLILVTHDESTFFQNDERNTGWSHATSKSKPKAKGNGQSLMVSDFLTSEWGRLRDGDE